MKHARLLVIFLFVLLLPLSWYKMYSDSSDEEALYQAHLVTARSKAKLQIVKEASQSYQAALAMHNSSEIQLELAQMYYDNRRFDAFEDLCNQIVSEYPYEIAAYERLAQHYYDLSSFAEVLSIRDNIRKRNLDSSLVNDLCHSIGYSYTYLESYDVSDISNFYDGFARVRTQKGTVGYIAENGRRVINYIYAEGSIIRQYGIAGITTIDGESYIIDTYNDKVSADPQRRKITFVGTINDTYFPVVLDNKYYVSDYNFNLSEDNYDYIGGFSNGLAAARQGMEWFIINGSGKRISDKTYEDIILDECEVAFSQSRAFVKIKDHYIMIGTDENQIGTITFENATNFTQTDQPTAVQIDGKWGFINQAGEIILEPQYENAHPFSRGLAGVMGTDGWDFIDVSGKVVIEGPFEDVRNFSNSGTAFVQSEDQWKLIQLYDNSVK